MAVKRTVMKRKAVAGKRGSGKTVVSKKTVLSKTKAKATSSKAPANLRGLTCAVINLDSRPDRWEKIQKSFARSAPWLRVTRLSAVDGRSAPPPQGDVTKKWSTKHLASLFPWYKAMTVKMSPGERGCCGSHVKAWHLCAKSNKPLLVIEDDAVALKQFSETLSTAVKEAPKGTGMIFLSSKDRGTRKRIGKALMEPFFIWTTVGYLVYPATARQLLKMRPLDMPVDNFLGWHIKEGTVKAYSVTPAAVRQAQTWNVASDVPHSDDVAHW